MTAPVLTLLSQWSERVLSWGIEVSAKALVCGLLVYLVHLAVGRRRVLLRSVLWNAAVIGLLILPVAVAFSPRWNLAVWPAPPAAPLVERDLLISTIEYEEVPSMAIVATEPLTEPVAPWQNLALIVCGVYLLGVCVGLVRIARGLRGVALLRRQSVPVEVGCWNAALERWRRQLGLTGAIELRCSESVSVPLVMGARRPVVIIPTVLSTLTEQQTIDAVLLHELAHVGRHDFAWNVLAKLVQSLYWFHPVGWSLGRILHQVREDACDAVCIHWLGGAREYVGVLVELVVSYVPRPLAALGLGVTRTSRLSRRLRRLAEGQGNARYVLGQRIRGVGILAVALMVLVLASARLSRQVVAEDAAKKASNDESRIAQSGSDTEDSLDPFETRDKVSARKLLDAAGERDEEDRIDITVKPLDDDDLRRKAREALEEVALKPGKKVAVVKVRLGKVQDACNLVCKLTGFGPMRVYPRLSGVVTKQIGAVGDVVKKGDVLAEIDVPDADVQIARARSTAARAEADLTTALSQLDAAQIAIRAGKALVEQAQAEAARAKASVVYQQKQYDRLAQLSKQNAVGVNIVDEAEDKLSAAKAEVKSTEAKVAASEAQLAQAEAEAKVKVAVVRAEEVELVGAREMVAAASMAKLEEFRVIRAPADGVIAERHCDVGAAVSADRAPMFVLNSSSVIAAMSNVPDGLALKMKKGMLATVTLSADLVHRPGKVTEVGYVIDPATGTFPCAIGIPNPEGTLRPGMSGTARIVMRELELPVVPSSAVIDVMSKFYCYKWTGTHFAKVPVRIQQEDGNQIAIAEGIAVDDEVALDAKSIEVPADDPAPLRR